MKIFEAMRERGHEQVTFFSLTEANFRAIIAIHDTTLGPALGGVRMRPYASEEDALEDVLRLSRAMTYKAAAAGIHLGGGKAVIIGDPKKDKSELLFRAFGRAVHALGGRYITAEDSGTDVHDMESIYAETPYVTGVDRALGGSGDPAPFTAYGVLQGMRACVRRVFGDESLRGRVVSIQGLGAVGSNLARLLKDEGAAIIGADVDEAKARQVAAEVGVELVAPSRIAEVECDVFAPCAMGNAITEENVGALRCRIVAGSANNQLEHDGLAEVLHKRGILYAPDFVINAGGLLNVYVELEGYNQQRARRLTRNIYYNVARILSLAEQEDVSTLAAANRLAERRIAETARLKARLRMYPGLRMRHRVTAPAADDKLG